VIKDLVKAKYIQVNNGYSNALHICKSYRIHPDRIDLSTPFSFIEQEYNQHFERKLQTLKMLNFSQRKKDDEDDEQAKYMRGIINDNYKHVINQTSNLFLVPSNEALAYVTNECKRLNNPNPAEYYFTYFNSSPIKSIGVDAFGNRLHSVITNMAKIIRKCLRYQSSPAVRTIEIDIVNSQPFFLSAVTSELIAKYVPVASEAIPIFCKYENDNNFIKFKNYCRDGRIYEYLQAAYELDYGSVCKGTKEEQRDFTKTLTYSALFGDYELKDNTVLAGIKEIDAIKKQQFYLVFKEQFKAVYNLFKEVKALQWSFTVNNKGERKQYANNCLLAQRLESGVMYNQIISACVGSGYEEITTVHDCLLVREDEYSEIKEIAEKAFNEINLSPKFK